jgi:coproporphyrinogen III oxidase-like Fe-S oxidoreductase
MYKVNKLTHDSGINVLGNYMFGLPEDNMNSMQETLDLAKELNCEFANFYCVMPYPGSKLYQETIEKKIKLPDSWIGYSQHSYECQPLPTQYLKAEEVLKFRDFAFNEYFTSHKYLNMIEEKFGLEARNHIKEMTKIKLKRKILGD